MAGTRIVARSVSRQVREWLDRGPQAARVLAAFDRVCNLVTGEGSVIALVAPQVGDGPLNVVLGGTVDFFGTVRVGAEVTCDRNWLLAYGGACHPSFHVDLCQAATWEPCPDWARLRARRGQMLSLLGDLRALCAGHSPRSVLEPLLGAKQQAEPSRSPGKLDLASHLGGGDLAGMTLDRALEAAVDLCAGWSADGERLRRGGAALAGLGAGLTPAGDDFLSGAMLAAWLAHPTPRRFCQILAQAAAPRTTALSAAFLRAAARGQCNAAWHRLLGALAEGTETDVIVAAQRVLGLGATSGADTLVGFLYLVRCARPDGGITPGRDNPAPTVRR